MNKKVKNGKHARKKKIPKANIIKIPPEVKDHKIELFTKQSDQFAEQEAKKRRESENKKVQFINGSEIDLDEYIDENFITERKTHYFKPFYLSLADLFGVDAKVMEIFRKPRFVPKFKNYFILGRFPQPVVNRLKAKNKYVGYFRKYYYYQLITKKADAEYRNFIWQAQEMAILYKGQPKRFIVEYCTKYGLSIQLDLFDGII